MDFRADILPLQSDGQDPATGILRGRAILAKEGVYTYSDGQRTWREYTPASVLTDKAWLDSLRLAPVTLNHPREMVTSDNAKGLAVGAIGDTVIQVGSAIASPITVWDRAAADSARTTHREVSLGYHAHTVDEAGIWNGQHYDSKQTRRVANHVALVDRGRHGPDVRTTFDSADGTPSAPIAVSLVGDLGADDMKTIEQLTAELEAVTTRADTAEAERDAVKAQIDEFKTGGKCKNCGAPMKDGKFCADEARDEIKARVALEESASKAVKDYKADGKSDRQVRLDILAAWGVKIDEARTDDYVTARLDAETEHRAGKRSPSELIADAASKAGTEQAKPEPDANSVMRGHWGM
jgi:hypothetical protein